MAIRTSTGWTQWKTTVANDGQRVAQLPPTETVFDHGATARCGNKFPSKLGIITGNHIKLGFNTWKVQLLEYLEVKAVWCSAKDWTEKMHILGSKLKSAVLLNNRNLMLPSIVRNSKHILSLWFCLIKSIKGYKRVCTCERPQHQKNRWWIT